MSALFLSRRYGYLLSSLLLLAPALESHANEDDAVEHLLVTGTRAGTGWHDNASALSWVSAAEMEQRRPGNMGEVLNLLPGVFWTDLGNEQHSMSIRQPISTGAYYLYLEDGIPIRPLGVFNHNALNEVSILGANQIEVLKGPASSLYGSNAVGGAINFLTRAASDDSVRLQTRGDDQGYWRADVKAEQSWQDGGLVFSHYTAQRRDGWQEHGDMDKDSTTLRVDQQLSEATRIWLTASYSDLRTDMPGSLNEADYRADPGKSYNRFTYRADEASRVTGFIEHQLSEQDELRLALFWRKNSHAQLPSYLIFNTSGSTASGRENDNRYRSRGMDLYFRHAFTSRWLNDVVVGAYLDRSPNDYDEWSLAITRDPSSGRYLNYTTTGIRRDYRADISNDAYYAQLRGQFASDWLWLIGAREDRITYDFDNFLTPSNTTGPDDERREFSHLSPKLGVVYRLAAEQSLFFSASQGFLPPEVSALYARLDVPSLKESVFDNLELGWRGQWDALRADVTVYQLDGDDELVSYSIVPGLTEPRNAGATRHRGVELGLDYRFSAQWSVQLAAAVARHEFLDYAISSTMQYDGNRMRQAPEQLLQVAIDYRPQDNWLLRLSAVHVSDYWMDDSNSQRYDGHDLLQAYVSWQHDQLTVFANVHNLTDAHYAETASYSGNTASYTPGAPRTVSVGLSWDW